MNYIVGLDFGTHQTKICIEDTTNVQPIYEFLEFTNSLNNTQSVILPSIVQVNKDGRLSYGFVDSTKAMYFIDNSTKPTKAENRYPLMGGLLPEPKYIQKPKEPQREKQVGYLAILASLLPESREHAAWRGRCQLIEQENQKLKHAWEHANSEIDRRNKERHASWELKQQEIDELYDLQLSEWEKSQQKKRPYRYRYFKQATFVSKQIWSHADVSPEIISIWYLTYVRFLLDQRLGKDSYLVRMGVPCAAMDLDAFTNRAYSLWYAAGELQELYVSLEDFLNASYEDLKLHTKYKNISYDETSNFDTRTEAQAGLFPVISNGKIQTPVNLLMDIGGGTTDIGVFHNLNGELKILETISIPKGLNFIFEEYQKKHQSLTLEDIQDKFSHGTLVRADIESSISTFIGEVQTAADKLASYLILLMRNNQNLEAGRITDALAKDYLVYCGGGSLYEKIRNVKVSCMDFRNTRYRVTLFTEKRVVDKSLIGIRNIRNKSIPKELFTILATSYGLSLADNWQIEEASNIQNTLGIYVPKEERTNVPERNDDD